MKKVIIASLIFYFIISTILIIILTLNIIKPITMILYSIAWYQIFNWIEKITHWLTKDN